MLSNELQYQWLNNTNDCSIKYTEHLFSQVILTNFCNFPKQKVSFLSSSDLILDQSWNKYENGVIGSSLAKSSDARSGRTTDIVLKLFHSLLMMVSGKFVASLSLTQVQYQGTVSKTYGHQNSIKAGTWL